MTGEPTKTDFAFRRARDRALRIGRALKSCLCLSRGLVDEKRTTCPAHGRTVASAPNRSVSHTRSLS